MLSASDIVAMQRGTAEVIVDEQVIDYAVRIAAATRKWPGISMGAGPRGSIALVRAARAQAVLHGRDFVTPDDMREIAKPALRHRITLAPELQIEGQSPTTCCTRCWPRWKRRGNECSATLPISHDVPRCRRGRGDVLTLLPAPALTRPAQLV